MRADEAFERPAEKSWGFVEDAVQLELCLHQRFQLSQRTRDHRPGSRVAELSDGADPDCSPIVKQFLQIRLLQAVKDEEVRQAFGLLLLQSET